MSYADFVRSQLTKRTIMEHGLFTQVRVDSREYCRILGISEADHDVLERIQGKTSMYPDLQEHMSCSFLRVRCDQYEFAFFAKFVCGGPYGGD